MTRQPAKPVHTSGDEETPEFSDRAVLHEKVVQAVARGEIAEPQPPKRRRRRRADVNEGLWRSITDLKSIPNQTLREHAMQMEVPPRHVEVIGPDEVIIWNHPAPWPRR